MQKLASLALLVAISANACPEYNGYVIEHFPTYDNYITGTILGTTDDGATLRFTLFGYHPIQPLKGDVSWDFVVRHDKNVVSVMLDDNACQFIISFNFDPNAKGGF